VSFISSFFPARVGSGRLLIVLLIAFLFRGYGFVLYVSCFV
jgi:hypothetical protein